MIVTPVDQKRQSHAYLRLCFNFSRLFICLFLKPFITAVTAASQKWHDFIDT